MPLTATPLYFAVMAELERRRLELGLSMDMLCEGAGASERYWSKAVRPETPSGRQAHWETLAPFVEALFPEGFEVRIRAKKQACKPASLHKVSIRFSGARYDFEARRDWMAEISKRGASRGGKARWQGVSDRKRKKILSAAARKRWLAKRGDQIAKSLEKSQT